jgi:tetratricopeptide (TPR) repeat protein
MRHQPSELAKSGSSSARWNVVLGGSLIVLAALVAYKNCFAGPIILDDVASLCENPRMRHLWPICDALTPSPGSLVGGRPVISFSLAFNYALGGLAVWGYHAFNLAIHILTGLILYGVVRRTLLRPSLQEQFGASATRLALAVAVLWTVHPLQTEAVTYVSERCESLMGLFYLLTLYGFIRGADSRNAGRWFTLSVVACFLGMASKEVMATAPAMVLLYDRTFVSRSLREAWTRHRQLYLGLAGTWLWLGYLMVGLHYRAVGFGLGIPWWAYALTESRAVVHYLCLAFWPHPLVFDYGNIMIWRVAEAAPYALILAVLGAGVLLELRRQPPIGFIGAWFFIILAPASSVIPVVGQAIAEHRMYLPLAAVVTLVVMGINALLGRHSMAVFLVLAMGFVVLTVQRNEDYRTRLSIWTDTIAKRPDNARAHGNLGLALMQMGKSPEAIGEYEQALRIEPNLAEAHNNLGLALVRLGNIEEAAQQFEQAVQIKPDYAEAHYNLALTSLRQGKIEEGIRHLRQAVRTRPDYAEAYNDLGWALLQAGKASEAIEQCRQALRIRPDYVEAHNNLGLALASLGIIEEATQHFEQAVRIKPDYAEAHYNLGVALLQTGRMNEAISHFERVLELRPDFAQAQFQQITSCIYRSGLLG